MSATDGRRGQFRFTFACAAVLLFGCALRLHPWAQPAPVQPPQALSGQAIPTIAAEPPIPPQVFHTLMDFYTRLDRGSYAQLYETVLEGKWQLAPDGSCGYAGLAGQDEFVTDVGKEFEATGAGINILSCRMTRAKLVAESEALESVHPELAMLAHLPQGMQLKAVYRVEAEGDLGPACLPASWRKTLYVANFAPDEWRVLLAISPGAPRKTQWFADAGICGRVP